MLQGAAHDSLIVGITSSHVIYLSPTTSGDKARPVSIEGILLYSLGKVQEETAHVSRIVGIPLAAMSSNPPLPHQGVR